jgi:uncharacterized protein (DUF427 family)
MTMTVGAGPFGHQPAGRFNFELPPHPIQYLEDFPRRIRGLVGSAVVVDSVGVKLLHEQHRLPVWCFPPDDVLMDHLGGTAQVHLGGLAEGLVTISWDAVDQWLEEDEEVIVHPRDPYHRIELRATSRHVEVALRGETLGASSAALALFEASLPPRWYLPARDICAELIPNIEVRTGCAYKGWASYYDVAVDGRIEPALAWCYEEPLRGMERIKDHICFFNERVDLRLEGAIQERPQTQWSSTAWTREEWAGPRVRRD